MSDKVKLTKEQADALEGLMTGRGSWDKVNIVSTHAKGPNWSTKECDCLNGLQLDLLIRALYIGYEVQKTPEERILSFYKAHRYVQPEEHMTIGIAVETVLDIFNIKVPGINQ